MQPQDYKAMLKWLTEGGSFGYYIGAQQEQAARENAPKDALYKRDEKWVCVSDLELNHSFRMRYEGRDKRLPTASVEDQIRSFNDATNHIARASRLLVVPPIIHRAWRSAARDAINTLQAALSRDLPGENDDQAA